MTCANVFFAAAKAIIDSGIDDVDTPDWNGNSPLILCARNKGWKTLSESLLDMGADMRHQNNVLFFFPFLLSSLFDRMI